MDAEIDELVECEFVRAGTAGFTRVGAGLDQRDVLGSEALVVDLGGPGGVWSRYMALDLFGPAVQRDVDVWVYREPWTLDVLSADCADAARRYASAVTEGDWPVESPSLDSCRSAQQTLHDYGESVAQIVERLDAEYASVSVLGFSFGATRLRAAASQLPAESKIVLVEPGPHPEESILEWGVGRVTVAERQVEAACSAGSAADCALLERRASAVDRRDQLLLDMAITYRSTYLEDAPADPELMAAYSLSINESGEMLGPGVGFVVGLCLQSSGGGSDSSFYSALAGSCSPMKRDQSRGQPAAEICLVVNPAAPIFENDEAWLNDPAISSVQRFEADGSFHGAALDSLIAGNMPGCPW